MKKSLSLFILLGLIAGILFIVGCQETLVVPDLTTTTGTTTSTTTTSGTGTTSTSTSTTTTTTTLVGAMLIKPMGDDLILDTTPEFKWSDLSGASFYQVQIDDNNDFSSITKTATVTTSSHTSEALSEAAYYWRVRANDGINWGSWSIVRRLVIGQLVGDVNGDDYSDIIVGAYRVGTDKGEAYIYFGGASFSGSKTGPTDADVTITGEANDERLGFSVATAGDINGDGYADVIVGADRAGGSSRGKAYICYGGASMDGIPDVIISGESTNDELGQSVSGAGDLNGDGYMDVIVGAHNADGGGSVRGEAYIYYGSSGLSGVKTPTEADVTLSGVADDDEFGRVVSGAGDVNGDGFADVIVGVGLAEGGGTDRGEAYIYYGGSSMNNAADVTISGAADDDKFGRVVSGAGDVNGDGYADVIMCDIVNGSYIYYGGSSFSGAKTPSNADVTIAAGLSSVSGAGDLNGDAFADVIVGTISGNGQAQVYYGGASMDTTADLTMNGAGSGDQFGVSVSGAGDMDRDGYGDLIVGAILAGGSNNGAAYIYYGDASMDNTADVTISGGAGNDYLGKSVSGGK